MFPDVNNKIILHDHDLKPLMEILRPRKFKREVNIVIIQFITLFMYFITPYCTLSYVHRPFIGKRSLFTEKAKALGE